jgi:hypothetical protein
MTVYTDPDPEWDGKEGKEAQSEDNNGSLPALPPEADTSPHLNESIVRTVAESPDYIEIGTPGKGGSLKIYFDAGDLEGAKVRVMNAMKVRDLANQPMSPESLSQRMQA